MSLYIIFYKNVFQYFNESQKKTMALFRKRGLNATNIAKVLGVSLSTISRHLQKIKNDSNYFNKKTFPKNRKPCLDHQGERCWEIYLLRSTALEPTHCWKCTSVTWAWQVCTATSIYSSSIFLDLERRLKEVLRTKV